MGERSSVWMNAVIRGDVNSIRVGANSNVQDCAVLHGQRNLYPVIVGDWVTIGHNATVHGCTVGDMVVIGMGATVLNNATDRRGLHHCRRVGSAGAYRSSSAYALGRRTRKDAPRNLRQGHGTDQGVREELPGLRRDLSCRSRQVSWDRSRLDLFFKTTSTAVTTERD